MCVQERDRTVKKSVKTAEGVIEYVTKYQPPPSFILQCDAKITNDR